ncbi:transcription initiation factor IIA subunit 1-like [Agrilus planipennis]|uniref:Transcription initiation factor IIA subunit 1-like n=1 Tax=Agrilus planipennis TaxID=224129 RepID=A0A7F5R4A0_AGRPL|nr:transcription initiation factor IIA subunit 1-like [Agrilus planipennis]
MENNKKTNLKFYQDVIEDVLLNCKKMFIEEDIDEQIIPVLNESWNLKIKNHQAVKNSNKIKTSSFEPQQHYALSLQIPKNSLVNQMVPIKVLLGKNSDPIQILIPSKLLENNQLQKILSGSLLSTIISLPKSLATDVLQQHINDLIKNENNN